MQSSALLLYSGGSDSTWLAYKLAQEYRQVYLLTLDRRTFFKAKTYTQERAGNLIKYFGSSRVEHHVISIDDLHSEICFDKYFENLKRYGSLMASLSFSKLSMHWAALRFARLFNIQHVFDGGTNYMNMYPDQNKNIGHKNYLKLYQEFGIQYEQPLYEDNLNVEENLYLVGLNSTKKVRGTADDKQVYYLEQALLAHFLNFYLTRHSWDQYEEQMEMLYADKVEYIKRQIS
jgi:hypothetical protein